MKTQAGATQRGESVAAIAESFEQEAIFLASELVRHTAARTQMYAATQTMARETAFSAELVHVRHRVPLIQASLDATAVDLLQTARILAERMVLVVRS